MMQDQNQIADPQKIYFVPPPINQLNKHYYQQLQGLDNPVHHATKAYVCFDQLMRLDQSEHRIPPLKITQKVKETLQTHNRNIYGKMIDYLASLSGLAPLQAIKSSSDSPTINQQVQSFFQICLSVKHEQTRRDICEHMHKQSSKIRARSNQIRKQLQKIKQDFKKAAIQQYQ